MDNKDTREIKFRAFYAEDKKLVIVNAITELPTKTVWEDGSVLMQFTGLHDKNGKEIFEGDIILKDGICFEITWNRLNASFYCKPKRLLDTKLRPGHDGFDEVELYEVVGNIYENPELMLKKRVE